MLNAIYFMYNVFLNYFLLMLNTINKTILLILNLSFFKNVFYYRDIKFLEGNIKGAMFTGNSTCKILKILIIMC